MANLLTQFCQIPGVTDVLVNGPNSIWIDRGRGLEKIAGSLPALDNKAKVREFAFRTAIEADERLDENQPVLDCKLKDGSRFHAVISPIVDCGAVISLRIPSQETLDYSRLVKVGTIPFMLRDVIPRLVESKMTILITGSTGSGKTTLLKALIDLVPPDQRILAIEEFAEINQIAHPHFVSLRAKRKNTEGIGEITLEELVKASLRMRPDRIILGECRGPEIKELLSAFNTGHSGGFSTLHANDVSSVGSRLEALGGLAGLNAEVLASQVVSAIDLILHMKSVSGLRKLYQLGKPVIQNNKLMIEPILRHRSDGKIEFSPKLLAWQN